jgi:hypothetical protein
MTDTPCPKCGGKTSPVQVRLRSTRECVRCGRLPFHDGQPEWGRGGTTPLAMDAARYEEAMESDAPRALP